MHLVLAWIRAVEAYVTSDDVQPHMLDICLHYDMEPVITYGLVVRKFMVCVNGIPHRAAAILHGESNDARGPPTHGRTSSCSPIICTSRAQRLCGGLCDVYV